jgi:hypothetical protein
VVCRHLIVETEDLGPSPEEDCSVGTEAAPRVGQGLDDLVEEVAAQLHPRAGSKRLGHAETTTTTQRPCCGDVTRPEDFDVPLSRRR